MLFRTDLKCWCHSLLERRKLWWTSIPIRRSFSHNSWLIVEKNRRKKKRKNSSASRFSYDFQYWYFWNLEVMKLIIIILSTLTSCMRQGYSRCAYVGRGVKWDFGGGVAKGRMLPGKQILLGANSTRAASVDARGSWASLAPLSYTHILRANL